MEMNASGDTSNGNDEEPTALQPAPLEPTLAELIVEKYTGTRDDDGRFHTTDEASPGNAVFKGGHTYEGQFYKGMMHGNGVYEWADGTVYEGAFQWNSISGTGQFTWKDGSTYEGGVQDGLRHGEGTFTGADGSPSYRGEWHEGVRHGKGTLWYDPERKSCYEGEWKRNKRHGFGRMQWKPESKRVTSLSVGGPRKRTNESPAEGNVYTGLWENDRKCGKGVMEWFDRQERYDGEWKDDVQNGQGEHIWLDNRPESVSLGTQKQMFNRYTGGWKDGKRDGTGTFFYANGAKYDGQWSKNVKEGYGVFIFEDGHVYEGPFSNDRMVEKDSYAAKHRDDALQPQLCLHISDVIPSNCDAHQEISQLEKSVLRYTSELKMIYKRYSALEDTPTSDGVFALNMAQFRQLWAHCSLGSYDISLVTVYHMLSAMRTQHACEVQKQCLERCRRDPGSVPPDRRRTTVTSSAPDSLDRFDSLQPLLFREFVELLARIAIAAFSNKVPRIQAGEAFSQLMTQAIQTNHSKPTVKGSFDDTLRDEGTRQVFEKYNSSLRKIFAVLSSRDARLSLRKFLTIFQLSGLDAAKDRGGLGLDPAGVLAILVVSGDGEPLASDPTLLDSEMIWDEFLEALAHIALQAKAGALPDFPQHTDDSLVEEEDDAVVGAIDYDAPFPKHLDMLLGKIDYNRIAEMPKDERPAQRPARSHARIKRGAH